MLSAGDAFLVPDDPQNPTQHHLWIIISDPARNAEEILWARVTTWEKWKDDACLMDRTDGYAFIKHLSSVDYRSARIEKAARIEKWLAGGQVKVQPNVGAALLAKIRAGAQETRFLPNKCQLFLADQGLLEL
jgi:hypothetical protein